jgi:redox-sensitive bicupin YhaK (pirin superfamily)
MVTVRKGADRGRAAHGWLESRHTFSFAEYQDPAHIGFGPLRVINEDRVAPGAGFPRHAHQGIVPSYEQKTFALEGAKALLLVASGGSRNGALTIHQDADVYAGRLAEGATVTHGFHPQRLGWVQVARGRISLNGLTLAAGDGAAVERETELTIRAGTNAEVLLFDMAP